MFFARELLGSISMFENMFENSIPNSEVLFKGLLFVRIVGTQMGLCLTNKLRNVYATNNITRQPVSRYYFIPHLPKPHWSLVAYCFIIHNNMLYYHHILYV